MTAMPVVQPMHLPTVAVPADHRFHLSSRRSATLVGLLFLVATFTFATGNGLIGGVLETAADFEDAPAHNTALAIGALLAFAQGIAIVGIAVLLYPLLKRVSEPLALGYVGLRVAELAATLLYVAVPLTAIELGGTGGSGTGQLLLAQQSVAVVLIYLVTSVNGLVLAALLYRSAMVPRSIAVLGLVGYPTLLVGCMLAVANGGDMTHGAALLALVPGGIYEVVLPLWLIVKGFRISS